VPAIAGVAKPFIRETGLKLPTFGYKGKVGSKFARRLGLDGKDATVNDYIHILLSSISVEE